MSDADDAELLTRFTRTKDARAFATLVARHQRLVTSAARRQVHDSAVADDVTQAVFIVLARKAASVDGRSLTGWLLAATRLASKNALRTSARRAAHERRAAMNLDAAYTDPTDDQVEAIRPVIDDAMARLGEVDRSAVALRFFEELPLADVGRRLGLTEEATRKRVTRSLVKLRRVLSALGVSGAPALSALGPAIAATGGSQGAGHLLSSAALAEQALSATSTSSNFIASGVIRTMIIAKTKLAAAAVVGASILALAAWQGVDVTGAPATAAVANGEAGPVGKLAGGWSVQLIGIAEGAGAGKWWAPDGSPLTDRPSIDLGDNRVEPDAAHVARVVALRADLKPGGAGEAAGFTIEIPGSRSWATQYRDDQWHDQVGALIAELPEGKPATIRFKIAGGEWKLRAETDGRSSTARGMEGGGAVLISETFAHDGMCGAVITTSGTVNMEQCRVIASTTNGDMAGVAHNRLAANDVTQSIYMFPGLDVGALTSVRVESRPFDRWIEFQNVSTESGQKSEVKVVTSDGR